MIGAESKDPENIFVSMLQQGVLTMHSFGSEPGKSLNPSVQSPDQSKTELNAVPFGDRDSSLRWDFGKSPTCPLWLNPYRDAVAELNPGAGYVGNFSRVRFAR